MGYKKVGAEELLPNYMFKKGVNVNFGNVTKNNVASMNNATVTRWLGIITRNLINPKLVLNANKAAVYRKILEGVLESRPENNNRIKALSPIRQSKARQLRTKIISNARNSMNLIEGKLALMGRGRVSTPSARANASVARQAAPPRANASVTRQAAPPRANASVARQTQGANNVVGKISQQIKSKFPNSWKSYLPAGPRSVARYATTYGTNVQGLYSKMQNATFQYKTR
jgi:hypothetical protein